MERLIQTRPGANCIENKLINSRALDGHLMRIRYVKGNGTHPVNSVYKKDLSSFDGIMNLHVKRVVWYLERYNVQVDDDLDDDTKREKLFLALGGNRQLVLNRQAEY
ncbi:unnamed protein product [Ambrosiozyma monospora]|uniref:Unnamed protein product n=1 Tax=Ambrosiozyma monospora TaxID=43982 RepID=A0ACB5TUY9_AMBMO|nr:unnamed protein product [Ambrosiozyma monospora]